jgi:hypothetical protein
MLGRFEWDIVQNCHSEFLTELWNNSETVGCWWGSIHWMISATLKLQKL